MRFQVPQNLDIRDTVFLGLDFRQLTYLGGAVGFMIFLFFFAGGFLPSLIFGGPVLVLALALSFFTYNSQSFIVLLQAAIRFFTGKKVYVWEKEKGEVYAKREMERKSADSVSVHTEDSSGSDRVKGLGVDLIFSDDVFSDSDPDVTI